MSENKDPLTERIIACCFKVHSELGPGFNERLYQNALKIALKEAGLRYEIEKEFIVCFEGKKIGSLRLDLVIDDSIIVEIKALVGNVPEVFKYQVLSYLKVSGLHTGLLVNFGNKSCQIKRLVF
ncbi:MAG: GxxExxY protein [Candidatus Omnitrophica bacterium CG07_land_8_20_14_0_80_42_15]|uniref:GxxExxY protein n=1 Tax=Candidatus Aquitaenariimonas noxiae TaxID=1974741 RepID=A0A2J0L318_9BACT|nr:MAG: GxxExxY protein [Candidatus Omnitrophica bacterium CG07_land_8_20_14_0_80_42_15]